MKLKSINVTELADESVIGVHSFSTDEEGVKEAEECFKAVVKENGVDVTEQEMEEHIEDGYFEQGSYQVFLTWSEGA